jgi:SAM-dependent methyltransferase
MRTHFPIFSFRRFVPLLSAKFRASSLFLLSALSAMTRIGSWHSRIYRLLIGRFAIRSLMNGCRDTALIYVAAKLGLADQLAAGPRESTDIARSIGIPADSLHRVLRGLVALGVLSQLRDGRFALSGLGTWLLTDKRGSLRGFAMMSGERRFAAYGTLLDTIERGTPRTRQNPALDEHFNMEMAWTTRRTTHSIVSAYDFSSFRTVADVGGGHGALIAAILNAWPSLRGVLFDQPSVAAGAKLSMEKAGVAQRCQFVGGNFLESIPCSADAFVLKNIIHNWDDEGSAAILRNCHQSLGKGGKVLLIERILPVRVEDDFDAIWLDLHMLASLGGRERTENEYRSLLTSAGFEFTGATPTWSRLWIIEGVRTDSRNSPSF